LVAAPPRAFASGRFDLTGHRWLTPCSPSSSRLRAHCPCGRWSSWRTPTASDCCPPRGPSSACAQVQV